MKLGAAGRCVSAVGIDLGTTYSVVARVGDGGEANVLPNPLGEQTTPSAVTFVDEATVLVGSTAKKAAVTMPDRTVTLIKRRMGTEHPLYFDGVEHTPESVSALILRSLISGLGAERVRAVVTVPAYFGVREREATQQACLLSGVDVLELLAEPVAAAIHYGFDSSTLGTYLVYDLGGGTFDATLLRTGHGRAEVVATDGDTELGGADWDNRLAEWFLTEFGDRTMPKDDPADDEALVAEVLLLAERTKKELTNVERRTVRIRHQGLTAEVQVDRADFEEMTRDVLERTFDCVRRLLRVSAAKGVSTVDRVLLVGGSSRMPMVGAGLVETFGWPVELHDPDFAVAKGAAIRASQLTSGGGHLSRAPGLLPGSGAITPVVPRSFGLLIHDSHEASGRRTFVEHVIHQNDPLPVDGRSLTVATIMNNQESVRIEVYEQAGGVESAEIADNRRVLDGQLAGLPPGPAGSPIRVEFHLGLDGRLMVTARDVKSGRSLALEAYVDGVLDGATRERLTTSLSTLSLGH